MIVLLNGQDTDDTVARVVHLLEGAGMTPAVAARDGRSLVICDGELAARTAEDLRAVPGVDELRNLGVPHHLTSREFRGADSVVEVGGGVAIGGPDFVVAAGPCAVEDARSLTDAADVVLRAGAAMLRGGAYKPRTSPFSFQGHGGSALKLLASQRARTRLPVVTEVLDIDHLSLVAAHADMIQIGARNMQNYTLLREAGRVGRPVLLKRGLSATIDEWLFAAEYVMCGGADVVLCERGIRTFERATRFTLDVSAIPVVKRMSHLPIIVDPSHASGDAALVRPLALAAAAAGADGLLVDVHVEPSSALCDGPQALDSDEFGALMSALDPVLWAVGRKLTSPARRLTATPA
jgi:3-deoxy-7-phosphoheptulonate synthase